MTSRYGRPPEFGLSPVPGGAIRDGPTRGLLHGSPEHWVETLSGFARKLGFDTFIFWPEADPLGQLDRLRARRCPHFAQEARKGCTTTCTVTARGTTRATVGTQGTRTCIAAASGST